MSQREYEDQPEAADLGEFIQEDSAETLTGPPNSDALDAGYVPPDRPYALDEQPALDDRDNLDARLRRERPDVAVDDPESGSDADPDRSGRLAPAAEGA